MPRPAQKRKAALLDQSGDGASTSPNDSRSTTDDVSPSPLPSTYPFRSSSPPKPARSTSSVPSQTSPNDSRSTTDDVSPSPLLSTYPSRSSSPPKPARNTSSVLSQASPLKQTSSLMSMSDVQHALASISPELIKLLRPEERNVLAKLVSRTTGNVIRGHDLLTIAEQAEPRPVKKQAEECLKRYVELLERQFDPTRRSLEELAKPVAEERTVADQKPTAKTTTRDTTTAKGEDKKPPRKSIISNPTDIAVLPDNPKREVLCISRPMSRHVVLSAAEQEALDDMTAPDYHQALNTAGISYGSLRTTYRCGSAAVPAYMWVNNQPTNRHTIDQPPQWLQNAAAGFSDVLVLDGLTALSTNVGLLMPVLATIGQLGGVIVVLNIDGPASVYSAQGFFDALEMLGDWLEGVVAYHGPGGMGPGDDPDHTAEATSMLVAATVLRRQS